MTPDAENAVISPILPFLYLGNERDAQDLDLLLRLNIGYVVNVTTHLPLYHVKSGLRYKRLPATDNSKQNLRQYFEEVFEFIGESDFYIIVWSESVTWVVNILSNCKINLGKSPLQHKSIDALLFSREIQDMTGCLFSKPIAYTHLTLERWESMLALSFLQGLVDPT